MVQRRFGKARTAILDREFQPCVLHLAGGERDDPSIAAGIAGVQHEVQQRILQQPGIGHVSAMGLVARAQSDPVWQRGRGEGAQFVEKTVQGQRARLPASLACHVGDPVEQAAAAPRR